MWTSPTTYKYIILFLKIVLVFLFQIYLSLIWCESTFISLLPISWIETEYTIIFSINKKMWWALVNVFNFNIIFNHWAFYFYLLIYFIEFFLSDQSPLPSKELLRFLNQCLISLIVVRHSAVRSEQGNWNRFSVLRGHRLSLAIWGWGAIHQPANGSCERLLPFINRLTYPFFV